MYRTLLRPEEKLIRVQYLITIAFNSIKSDHLCAAKKFLNKSMLKDIVISTMFKISKYNKKK